MPGVTTAASEKVDKVAWHRRHRHAEKMRLDGAGREYVARSHREHSDPWSAREMFSLSAKDAASLIAQVWREVREWKVHFEAFGASAQAMEQVSTAFRHIDDISTAQLRARLP
jgi:hypothetical protein